MHYDSLSRLSATSLLQGITRYSIDGEAQLRGSVTQNPGSSSASDVSDAHNGVSVTSSQQTVLERVEYDEAGRRLRVTNGADEVTRYQYDTAGNVIRSNGEAMGSEAMGSQKQWGQVLPFAYTSHKLPCNPTQRSF